MSRRTEEALGVLLATVMGAMFAVALVHGLCS